MPRTSAVAQRTDVLNNIGPVALVWAIAKSMPRASRGEILKACVAAGINERTAAGQVQEYLHIQKELRQEHSEARHRRMANANAAAAPRRGPGRPRTKTAGGVNVNVEPEVKRGRATGRTATGRRGRKSDQRAA